MDSSPTQLARLLLPRTPFILKTALLHSLSLSRTSSKWSLRTELTVAIIRQMLGPDATPVSISKQQRMTLRDPGVKGKMWVSKVRFELPENEDEKDEVRDIVIKCVKEMGTGDEEFDMPKSLALEAEWTGYRADVADTEPEPVGLSETQKYQNLMKEVTHPTTILYFHGGAMYLLDPATYRTTTSKIAHLTNGRVLSVRYRLSPQNPFPAALVDALHAYLTLLHPSPGSPHTAIPASQIVISGDSAGGLLSTALLQLLLHLHRSHTPTPSSPYPTISFHGTQVPVPLPAGLALISPWLDVTRSLPSIENSTTYDYLPPPSHVFKTAYPPCDIWPSSPPRADMYAHGSALRHPLVSPLAARDWKNSPPMFVSCGEEMLEDEDRVFAKRVAGQGGRVSWWQFEAMPHCFGMLLEWTDEARLSWRELAGFCRRVVDGVGGQGGSGENGEREAWFVEAKTCKKRSVDVKNLSPLSDEDVERFMREGQRKMVERVGRVEVMPML